MCWLLKLCILCFPFALCFALSIIGIPAIVVDFYFIYWSIKGMRAGKILFLYESSLIDRINSKPQVIRYENITNFWKSITKIYQIGKVILHQGGISWKKKTLNWTEFETVTLKFGVVYIRKKTLEMGID